MCEKKIIFDINISHHVSDRSGIEKGRPVSSTRNGSVYTYGALDKTMGKGV